MINAGEFKNSMAVMLAETFGVSDAPTGFFLDTGRSGLLGMIDEISAPVASAVFRPGEETIAAHCGHLLYALRIFNEYEQGNTPNIDWPGSWSIQEVDEEAWTALRADLRSAYETVMGRVQARDDWPQPAIGATLMLLAHCAYHVGVIQKMRSVVMN